MSNTTETIYTSDTKGRKFMLVVQKFSFTQLDRLCRICLTEGTYEPLIKVRFQDKTATEMLRMCTSVEVQETDLLPQTICSTCIEDLIKAYTFVSKCQKSETILKHVFKKRKADPITTTTHDGEATQPSEDIIKTEEHPVKDEPVSPKVEVKETQSLPVVKEEKPKLTRERPKVRVVKVSRSCKICNETFNTIDELKLHAKEQKHRQVRLHECKVCKKMYPGNRLPLHMRTHTKEQPYKCTECPQAFSLSGNLKRHMMIHTGERPYVCQVCSKGFIQLTSLQTHQSVHTNGVQGDNDSSGPPFTCEICGRSFKRLIFYTVHLAKYHSSESTVVKKITAVNQEKNEICQVCSKAFRTKQLLRSHEKVHKEKRFLCSNCGKGFVTKAALDSHFNIHTGDRPYLCNLCGKTFAQNAGLETHRLTHTGLKPYHCNVCMKKFTQLSHLKYHLRTHSGERPYACSYCDKTFALNGNLTVHKRTHTGETPFLCPVCGKGFYDSSSMKKHRRGHGEVPSAVS